MLYRNVTCTKTKEEKTLYLTFDDGPIPEITEYVLTELEKYKAKATFFCIGDNVRKYPDIFKKIVNSGHTVGNHTYHHLNGWKSKTSDYITDFIDFEKIHPTKIFRPPYGKIKLPQLNKIKQTHEVVLWDVLSGDFDKGLSDEKCLSHTLRNTKNGSIVVFHDSLKAERKLKYVLPRYLNYFSSMGFTFKPLH